MILSGNAKTVSHSSRPRVPFAFRPAPVLLSLLCFFLCWAALFLLSPSIPLARAGSAPSLRIALIPLRAPSRMYRDFLPLKHALEQRLQRSIDLEVVRKNSKIAGLFKAGKIDIAFVCPTLYCELRRQTPVVPLVRLRLNGRDYYRSVLVVRRDSPITRAADLMDRSLVYGRHSCPGSGLLPRIMLQRLGLSDDDFFEVVKLGNDESALLAVMARMFDVTGVPEMAVHSLAGNSLRILRYSEPIPQYLFVARQGLGPEFVRTLKRVMLEIGQAPDRKALIGSIEEGVDGFTDARDSDYDIVRVLIDSLDPGRHTSLQPGEPALVVEPLYYGADLFRRLKPMLSRLRQETGTRYQLRIPRDIEEFLAMQAQGRGDLYLQEASLFEHSRRPGDVLFGPVAVLPPALNRGLILVRSGGAVQGPADLRGRKIAVPSLLSEGGYLAQDRLLAQQGVRLEPGQMVRMGTCEQVVMAVYRGKVDAGFVTLDALRRLEGDLDPGRLKILARTPPLQEWLLTGRAGIPETLQKGIRDTLRTIAHPAASGQP
ncbi:MAG TPA: phosphate/phosphite/phosphonate ABC transporter substrate-binding protein [Desulfobulbus sp.]|nr:phosphate/phosphite/phosphonate ABC transporter substrate-binding protein [Desulfobulbus sp.]